MTHRADQAHVWSVRRVLRTLRFDRRGRTHNERKHIVMYVMGNPRTKKALREMIQAGERVTIFAPGLGVPKANGVENVEGPHYPEPHRWYARVQMKDGVVERIVS